MRLLDFGHDDAALEENGGGQDQDGGIYEHGAVQCDGGIKKVEVAGAALVFGSVRRCGESAPAPNASRGYAA